MSKGFGLTGLFIFIAFVAVYLVIFYVFMSNLLSVAKTPRYVESHNYKNAYEVYMQTHNINK